MLHFRYAVSRYIAISSAFLAHHPLASPLFFVLIPNDLFSASLMYDTLSNIETMWTWIFVVNIVVSKSILVRYPSLISGTRYFSGAESPQVGGGTCIFVFWLARQTSWSYVLRAHNAYNYTHTALLAATLPWYLFVSLCSFYLVGGIWDLSWTL